jgi:dTMP kinase
MKKYKLKKGVLIAIEGIDGAGKTTQVHRIKDYFSLKGFNCVTFKEPTDGQYGQEIRKLAQFGRNISPLEEMNLFLKDRIENKEKNILPALEKNSLVILDRYYFSSVAYQGPLGIDKELILRENEKIAVKPDLVIILDCAVQLGLSRIKVNRGETPNHFEKESFLEEARTIFKEMHSSYIQVIDSSSDEEQVFDHVRNIVQTMIAPYSYIYDDQPDLFGVTQEYEPTIFSKN